MSCNKFKIKQWKDNCFEMHECAIIIYKFLDNYLLNIDEIVKKVGDNDKYSSRDYYRYLLLFYWFEVLKENLNEKNILSDFKENVNKFNFLYRENLEMYQVIDAKDNIKLINERLTKHNINMYKTDIKSGDVSGVVKQTELFSDIKNLIDCINKTIYDIDILNDVGYMYDDIYMFLPECKKPIALKEFTIVEDKIVKKLKKIGDAPTVKDTIFDCYKKIFYYDDFLKYCNIKQYFKKLADDFNIFINDELMKIIKINYLNSK